MSTGQVAQPYMAMGLTAMVSELSNGKWLVARWEHLGPDEDLTSWVLRLAFACRAAGFEMIATPIPLKSMTVVWNADQPSPTREQIEESLRAAERARWLDWEIGSKLAVITGQSTLV